jgi:general L-amino acid transport system permease protein
MSSKYKINDLKSESSSFWYDPKWRNAIFQLIALATVVGVGLLIISVTRGNLEKQNIASGFGFLDSEAGFEISETLIEYWADDTYRKALWVGLLNTVKIAVLGNLLAIFLGLLIGVCRLSSNWLVSKTSQAYIEIIRNVPLLLQLLFWYSIFTEIFPGVKQAYQPIENVFISQRGFFFPVFAEHPAWFWVKLFFGLGFIFTFISWFFLKYFREKTGKLIPLWPFATVFILLIPLLSWAVGGAPTEIDPPVLGGFNFSGGISFTPEYIALLLGLVLYTSAFNAEIVRAAIISVSKGQWEAGSALGLTKAQNLRLVIIPQSLRVMIPPMTSQVLNLVKNSSLAVGIGYPDFVSVANTTMNQTGQAIEGVILIMLCYLFFSLSISFLMNFYNRMNAIRER